MEEEIKNRNKEGENLNIKENLIPVKNISILIKNIVEILKLLLQDSKIAIAVISQKVNKLNMLLILKNDLRIRVRSYFFVHNRPSHDFNTTESFMNLKLTFVNIKNM